MIFCLVNLICFLSLFACLRPSISANNAVVVCIISVSTRSHPIYPIFSVVPARAWARVAFKRTRTSFLQTALEACCLHELLQSWVSNFYSVLDAIVRKSPSGTELPFGAAGGKGENKSVELFDALFVSNVKCRFQTGRFFSNFYDCYLYWYYFFVSCLYNGRPSF